MMGPSVVGPVSNRSRPRPWTTGSALAFPEVAQNPLFGLVLARDPDLSAASGGPSSRRGPRPGSARSRAWARTRTRGGPGRWPGDASPSRGCALTRRRARSASGRPPRRLLPGCSRGARRGRNPRASRPQGGRLAGRQVDRGEEGERPEPPVLVVAPDRAPAARDGPRVGGGARARPGCPASRRGTARGPPGPPPRGRGRRPRRSGRTAARGAAARRASLPRGRGRGTRSGRPSCGARSGRPPGCRALPVATVASLGCPAASATFPAWAVSRSLALGSAA